MTLFENYHFYFRDMRQFQAPDPLVNVECCQHELVHYLHLDHTKIDKLAENIHLFREKGHEYLHQVLD